MAGENGEEKLVAGKRTRERFAGGEGETRGRKCKLAGEEGEKVAGKRNMRKEEEVMQGEDG